MARHSEKGLILIQVIVLATLMAFIASYMARWAFDRYRFVSRHQDFTTFVSRAESCVNQYLSASYVQMQNNGTVTLPWTGCSLGGTVRLAPSATLPGAGRPVQLQWYQDMP